MAQHPDGDGPSAPPRLFTRRAVARGTVWSIPVIAAASVIAPSAVAASNDDLIVQGICATGAVNDTTRRRFRVTATRAIPAGNTFTLTSSGAPMAAPDTVAIANNPAGGVTVTGPVVNAAAVSTFTITTTTAQAAGTFFDVVVTITAVAGGAVRNLRMAYNGTDRTPTNNASNFQVTVLPAVTGGGTTQTCGVITAT